MVDVGGLSHHNCWFGVILFSLFNSHVYVFLLEIQNLPRRFKTIDYRHIKVHQDELKFFVAAGLKAVLDEAIDCVLPAARVLTRDAIHLQHALYWENIERAIVDNQHLRLTVAFHFLAANE